MPETLHNAPIAIVDEDNSALSQRVASAFYPRSSATGHDRLWGRGPGMDAGCTPSLWSFRPTSSATCWQGRSPRRAAHRRCHRMSQAFTGSGYIQQIFTGEVNEFVKRYRGTDAPPVDLALRARFNPALDKAWFGSVVQIINHITLLSIILTGAALIREREHGTIEHLLVMPVTPAQIMLSKVWSMALVVLIASFLSLISWCAASWAFQPRVPLHCSSLARRSVCSPPRRWASSCRLARNMPQFGMLMMLTIMPLQMLSALRHAKACPEIVQNIVAGRTHHPFRGTEPGHPTGALAWRRCGSRSWRWP